MMKYLWHKSNNFNSLAPITQVYGVCFDQNGKILVIHEPGKEWNIPGGKPEKNERPIDTLSREISEEASVIIGKSEMIGYFKVIAPGIANYQLRFACLIKEVNDLRVDQATGFMNERKFVAPELFFDVVEIEDYRPMIIEAMRWFRKK
jgi:ADP-ribose pyrophosphatase YjhB (NUDIX family)